MPGTAIFPGQGIVREQDIDSDPGVYGGMYFHGLNSIFLGHAAIGYQVRTGRAALSSTGHKHYPNAHLSHRINWGNMAHFFSCCMQQYFFNTSGLSHIQLCLKPACNALSLCCTDPCILQIPNEYHMFLMPVKTHEYSLSVPNIHLIGQIRGLDITSQRQHFPN